MDLLRHYTQVARQARIGRIHLFAAALRGRVRAVGLELGLPIKAVQVLDHRAAGKRAPGVVEVGLTNQAGLLEGGELALSAQRVRLGRDGRFVGALSGSGAVSEWAAG